MKANNNKKAERLLAHLLEEEGPLYIQTHDSPDHDAVASACGLQHALKNKGLPCPIIFCGEVYRSSLITMINALKIEITPAHTISLSPQDRIILIDGCCGNDNVTTLPATLVAIIDHHQRLYRGETVFSDIRPHYGSCSTIITEYLRAFALPIPQEISTALLIGLSRDTDLLTRKVLRADVEAYVWLHKRANRTTVGRILRNNIQNSDLFYYRELLRSLQVSGELAFCFFPSGCPQNLMGILGDFLLSVEEIRFSALCSRNTENIGISLRNETSYLNAAKIMAELVDPNGSGGGHREMAGGTLPHPHNFDADSLFETLKAIISGRCKDQGG